MEEGAESIRLMTNYEKNDYDFHETGDPIFSASTDATYHGEEFPAATHNAEYQESERLGGLLQETTGLKKNSVAHLAWRAIQTICWTLVPSFLYRRGREPLKELHPTAYLDGLRGVAALIVVIFHFTYDWYPSLAKGWSLEEERSWFLQLPFIRMIHCGRGMVSIFFVISGYVLSTKSLKLMRQSDNSNLVANLSSSVFRRGFRLFLPCFFSTLPSIVLARYRLILQDVMRFNLTPPTANNLKDQIEHYYEQMSRFINIFELPTINNIGVAAPSYDGHLWTIPIEYRGSIVVFLTLLVISQCRAWLRPVLVLAGAIWCLAMGHWDLWLFLMGTFLASIQSSRTAIMPSSLEVAQKGNYNSRLRQIFQQARLVATNSNIIATSVSITTVILALLLLGMPELMRGDIAHAPLGYHTILTLTPARYLDARNAQKFWLAIGAVLLISAMTFSERLQRPFTTRFAQYLGYISYALYLVHGNVLYVVPMKMLHHTIARNMGGLTWENMPDQADPMGWSNGHVPYEGSGPPWSYAMRYWTAFLIGMTGCIYFADVFTRVVDLPCVRFAQWLQRKAWGK